MAEQTEQTEPHKPARVPHKPTSYTRSVHDIIIAAVRRGATLHMAAAAGGLGRRTLKDWLIWGQEDIDNGEEFSDLAHLTAEYAQAEFEFAGRMLDLVSDAAPEDWHAGAWLLERRFPKEYGKQVLEHVGEDGGAINIRMDDFAPMLKKIKEEEEALYRAEREQATKEKDASTANAE